MQSKNTPLILGTVLILIIIGVILGVAFIPSKLYKPTYDFVYTYKARPYINSYQDYTGYEVEQGEIKVVHTVVPVEGFPDAPQGKIEVPFKEKLYLYEISKNASREITFEEAKELELDQNTFSPDGFEVKNGSSVDGFLFFVDVREDYGSQFLVGHNAKHQVNLIKSPNNDRYYSNFKFLGWVIK